MNSRAPLSIGLLLGFLGLAGLFQTFGYREAWTLWRIPAVMPAFVDARVITNGAESHRRGIDPMLRNPTDPMNRPLNYPRIWQGLYALGVGPENANAFGVVLGGLFVLGILLFAPPLDKAGAALMLAGVFSPATLLAIERGNTDQLIFFLLALAILLGNPRPILALAVIASAFVLKLYPLAAVTLLWRQSKPFVIKATAALALLAVAYVLFSWRDLVTIRATTFRGAAMSYGVDVLWMKAAAFHATWGMVLRGAAYIGVGTIFVGNIVRARSELAAEPAASRALDGFRVGAACFTGSFLLGNNFDYRMIFLLFTIPQLWEWAKGRDRFSGLARGALVALFFSLWSLFLERWWGGPTERGWVGFLVGQAATWILFAVSVRLLFASAPGWLRRGSDL